MSRVGDIESALLAAAAAVVANLSTHQGEVNLDDIPADQYPFAYATQTGIEIEALDYLQDDEQVEVSVALVLNAEFETDRTLGGLVDDRTRVATTALSEFTGISTTTGVTRRVGAVVASTFAVR